LCSVMGERVFMRGRESIRGRKKPPTGIIPCRGPGFGRPKAARRYSILWVVPRTVALPLR